MKGLSVTICFCSLLVMQSCHLFSSKAAENSSAAEVIKKFVLADSFQADQTEKMTAYVLSDSAAIYALTDSHSLKKIGMLYLNDSVQVRNSIAAPFMDMFYSAFWKGRAVFIWGTALGQKLETDFDSDGKMDNILYGYSHYDTTSFADEMRMHPLLLKFLSATGSKYEVRDTGYSNISIEEMIETNGQLFSGPTKIYNVTAGYPACSYIQFQLLLACRNGRVDILHRHTYSVDGGIGNYYEVGLPNKLNHHTDSIYLSQKFSLPVNDDSDSLITTTADSSLIYWQSGKWNVKLLYKAPESTAR